MSDDILALGRVSVLGGVLALRRIRVLALGYVIALVEFQRWVEY